MPLRAKIQEGSLPSGRYISTSTPNRDASASAEPLGDKTEDHVLFGSSYGVRSIELNRPSKLNALSGPMAGKILERLQEWEKSQLANIIVIKGAGDRAFCAGGDVAELAVQIREQGAEGIKTSVDYFEKEYTLDHLIATYSKPYVAFMDGITMGGGVGLSVHAPFRIATERTTFAMPETKIGFFPDVGGSFFLPRLDGETGTYLALTGEILKGAHVFYQGIATHYLHSSSLPDLEERLAELSFNDYATLEEKYRVVNSTIEEFNTGLPENDNFLLSADVRELIDSSFRYDTLPEILSALYIAASDLSKPPHITSFAQATLQTLQQRCPLSLRVTLQMLRYGAEWPISESFQREFVLASRFMHNNVDFIKGVEAVLIAKPKIDPATGKKIPNPPPEWTSKLNWSPPPPPPPTDKAIATPEATESETQVPTATETEAPEIATTPTTISEAESHTTEESTESTTVSDLTYIREHFFTINEGEDRRLPLKARYDYTEYPHAWIGLPSEKEIQRVVETKMQGKTREEVVQYFEDTRRGKIGVRMKVGEVLKRKSTVGEDGGVGWKQGVRAN